MKKQFLPEEHFFMKAVAEVPMTYPITKAEAVERAKAVGCVVKTDFEQCCPLYEILANLGPETFDNFTHLRQAYLAKAAAKLKAEFHY